MLISDKNKLSYINKLMFREEFLKMLVRDFHLNIEKPFGHEVSIVSNEPPLVSTEISEIYTCYPDYENSSFQVKIRNLMIEQPLLNKLQVISDICFPVDFDWPVVEDEATHLKKEMDCFTGKKPSKWNLALIEKQNKFRFTDTFYLGYREDYRKNVPEIIQTSSFDPYRMIEYLTASSNGFEMNLDSCDEAKWESQTKVQYSIKKDKNGIYRVF